MITLSWTDVVQGTSVIYAATASMYRLIDQYEKFLCRQVMFRWKVGGKVLICKDVRHPLRKKVEEILRRKGLVRCE